MQEIDFDLASISGAGILPLGKMTLLFGLNGAGKSAILHGITKIGGVYPEQQAYSEDDILLFDNPDLTLDPRNIVKLYKNIQSLPNRVVVATQSPVLMSEFDESDCFYVEKKDGKTRATRITEYPYWRDLIAEYTLGCLYMSDIFLTDREHS
jgi:predicted ATPase